MKNKIMTHYKNIATIVLRVMAIMCLVAGLINSTWAWLMSPDFAAGARFWAVFIPYLIAGLSIFILSKLFAIIVCRGLDKNGE